MVEVGAVVGHEQVGARLAQRWKFPEPLVASIRDHHPKKSLASVENLSAVVATADLACNRAGLACGFDWTGEGSRRPVVALPPVVDLAFGKITGGMATLEERARAFLLHVTSRAPRWYATLAPVEQPGDDEQDDAQRDVA